MEHLHHRLDALEQQLRTLAAHTQTVERRLRGWRRLAWGLGLLALGGWVLHTSPAANAQSPRLDGHLGNVGELLKTLQALLTHVSIATDDAGRREIIITGANLRIVNGLGQTDCGPDDTPIPDCPNGLGNLIVGYNELREGEENSRIGSHNVVVGQQHNFSRFGGLVVGAFNTISGAFAAVSGGRGNTADGGATAVSGGENNVASGAFAAVSGGENNVASGLESSISGGRGNVVEAGASHASISGGSGITQNVFNGWAAGSVGDELVGSFRSP
jgi:hypothetical protein